MKKKMSPAKRAIEKDRNLTDALIRDYGSRFYAKEVAESIIDHLNFWRSGGKAKCEKRAKTNKA